MTRGRKICRGV